MPSLQGPVFFSRSVRPSMTFRRMLVKFSGESLGGAAGAGIDPHVLTHMARQISGLVATGVETGVVVGGGNLFRGQDLAEHGVDRITGDHMGMLATVMNALALKGALVSAGAAAEVLAAHPVATIAEGFSVARARQLLHSGHVVLYAGGTGSPLFTTDTAACLRAIETGAEVVVKSTRVDGVYSDDPEVDAAAQRYDRLSYADVLAQELAVMDFAAICLCRDHDLPIVVCDGAEPDALTRIARGDKVGTRIDGQGERR